MSASMFKIRSSHLSRSVSSVSNVGSNNMALTAIDPMRRQFSQSTLRLISRTANVTAAKPLSRPTIHRQLTTQRTHESQFRIGALYQRRCGHPQPYCTSRRQATTLAAGGGRRRRQPQPTSITKTGTVTNRKSTAHATSGRQEKGHNTQVSITSFRESLNNRLNQPRTLPVPRWISPQRFTFTYSEVCGHASFCLVAVSYAVDDFVQLRILAILGSSAMLVFTYFHPHGRVLWLPFKWNCLFIALNAWRVARVMIDMHWSHRFMSDTLVRIYDQHFYVLDKADFARLARLGTIETYRKGEVVVRQDEENPYVRLVLKGDLNVERDDQLTYMLHEGQFISETGLHAGLGLRGAVSSCCNVVSASDDVELLRWDRTELMCLLELDKSIERALRSVMSWDIVSKLKSQRELLANGVIADTERWNTKRREQTLSRYKAILRNMLAHPKYLKKRQGQLAKYREIHHVSDNEHMEALKEMGWTEEEFRKGFKEGQLDDDILERKRKGYVWWFQRWWNAI